MSANNGTAVSCLLSAAFLGLTGCSAKAQKSDFHNAKLDDSTVLVRDVVHVGTASLARGKFPNITEMPGRVVIPDKDMYVISSRVQGRLESVNVTVGDRVEKRQVLGLVWSPDLATGVEELKLAMSQGDKELIRLSKEKLAALGLDPDDVPSNTTTFPLRAPVGGVVLDRKLNAGASVQPGDVMLVIGRLGAYQFQGELTPDQALGVRPGMPVVFEDEPSLKAQVISVSPVADPSSRLIKIRCAFSGELPRRLPQETFLKAGVVVSVRDALIAPAKSLVLASRGSFIFVRATERDKDGATAYRRVAISVQSRNKTLIALEPSPELKDGLEVVSEGALLLNDILSE